MHHSRTRGRRSALVVLLALVSAVAVAACGSSSASSTSSSPATSSSGTARGAGSAQFAKYQSCLKTHGVTLPAVHRRSGGGGGPGGASGHGRPPGGGAGFFGAGGAAGTTRGKKFQAAAKACSAELPKGAHFGRAGGRAGGGHFSTATLTRFTACVKRHGYTLPTPNTSGKGPVFPRGIEKDKTFERAAKACQADLRPAAGGGPPAG